MPDMLVKYEIAIVGLIIDYFQEKLKWRNFQKIPKTMFWAHSGPFCPNLDQKRVFLEKKTLATD